MRDYIDVTGKNEDEAISKALAQLGLDRDDVSVEVLERAKSGFLGLGACPAKIRVYYGPEEEAPAPEPAPAPKPEPVQARPRSAAPEKKERPERRERVPREKKERPEKKEQPAGLGGDRPRSARFPGRRGGRREGGGHQDLPHRAAGAYGQCRRGEGVPP